MYVYIHCILDVKFILLLIVLDMFVNVMSLFMNVMAPSLCALPVCAYSGVMRYFWGFRFMCGFCFLYCDTFLVHRFCF